jgi:predicted ester cyclase
MSPEEIKALERRKFDKMNKGKAAAMAVMDETCATDFVYHSSMGEDVHGLKGYKQYVSDLYSAFPDTHITIDDMVVEGDKVALRWTVTGTHKGKKTRQAKLVNTMEEQKEKTGDKKDAE